MRFCGAQLVRGVLFECSSQFYVHVVAVASCCKTCACCSARSLRWHVCTYSTGVCLLSTDANRCAYPNAYYTSPGHVFDAAVQRRNGTPWIAMHTGQDSDWNCRHACFRKGEWYGWKPSSISNLSIRAFRAQISQFDIFERILRLKVDKLFPVEQFEASRAIQGSRFSVSSTLPPPSYIYEARRDRARRKGMRSSASEPNITMRSGYEEFRLLRLPCAGAVLVFSASFQLRRMIPEGNPMGGFPGVLGCRGQQIARDHSSGISMIFVSTP